MIRYNVEIQWGRRMPAYVPKSMSVDRQHEITQAEAEDFRAMMNEYLDDEFGYQPKAIRYERVEVSA